ncbi:hypothetical protein LTR84_007136 [Exophiala bonariae]|uniref:Xylanolytic transcriptional activator regulatory domain-containing protein n=1 Tax=Exophiala bonariae TaxID=1690606 RepID=A0AAV9MYJ0_9EURO|nr:hypothetical protein LTR84_007136 [Exophiala bonariae]
MSRTENQMYGNPDFQRAWYPWEGLTAVQVPRGEECIYAISKRGQRLNRKANVQATTGRLPGFRPTTVLISSDRDQQKESVFVGRKLPPVSGNANRATTQECLEIDGWSMVAGECAGAPTATDTISNFRAEGPILPQNSNAYAKQTPQVNTRSMSDIGGLVEIESGVEHEETVPFGKEDLTPPAHIFQWEHQGPASCLSICSAPAASWVRKVTGSLDFHLVARNLVVGWTRRCKIPSRTMLFGENKEPEADIAWEYCTAYFEESFEATYGFVDRSEFFTCLSAHFRNDEHLRNDPAWHALRNTVYASGCRIVLSKNDASHYSEIQKEAWSYFQNAMSAHTELLFTFTSIMAVRALIAMTFFTEGLGSPALQYMLCSSAARLAQSKGFHRQPAPSWKLDSDQIDNQNWLFWAIYHCDKSIALRSSRPSLGYYASILALYTPFMNPWISNTIVGDSAASDEHYQTATNTVADAARNLIVITTQIEINAASPQWQVSAFTYPLIGVTNLFIHILKAPKLPSVAADLALLDVAAGHYGRVELITESDMSFPFARKLAEIARKAVDKAWSACEEQTSTANSGTMDVMDQAVSDNVDALLDWGFNKSWDNEDWMLEDWSMLQPDSLGDFASLQD